MKKRKPLNIAAAALEFMGLGGTQEAFDKVVPAKEYSHRQRQRVINNTRYNLKRVSPEQRLISEMSNWQNHQWQKAGSPMDLENLEKFATLERAKQTS